MRLSRAQSRNGSAGCSDDRDAAPERVEGGGFVFVAGRELNLPRHHEIVADMFLQDGERGGGGLEFVVSQVFVEQQHPGERVIRSDLLGRAQVGFLAHEVMQQMFAVIADARPARPERRAVKRDAHACPLRRRRRRQDRR